MDISCHSFEDMSSTTEGGYSSHNISQEDDTMSFCFRDWKGKFLTQQLRGAFKINENGKSI